MAAGTLKCALCLSLAHHPDLAEPDPATGKKTPFARSRSLMVCDHCEMMLRYHTTGPELAMVGGVVKAFAEAPPRRSSYLRRLSIYLSLKSTEAQSKVHKVTLQKMDSIVAASARILLELEATAHIGAIGNPKMGVQKEVCDFAPMSLKS